MDVAGTIDGLLLLVFNVWTFPVPPAEVGSIDFGPFVRLWYRVVTVFLLRGRRSLGADEAAGRTS